jgi:hypothetical protein
MKKHGWLKDSCHNLLSPQLRGIAALTACEQRQDRQGMQNSRGSHLCMFFYVFLGGHLPKFSACSENQLP